MTKKWYAVCDHNCSYEEGADRDAALVWTVSTDLIKTGWNTDSGFLGYGLSRLDAEFLARAANSLAESWPNPVWRI